MKNKILHAIDSMEYGGGAEFLVSETINSLNNFDHVLISFSKKIDFKKKLKNCKIYSLPVTGKSNYLKVLIELRKIIRKEKPSLIHSHLPFATTFIRIVKPKNIPLLFSVHNTLTLSLKQSSKLLFFLERLLFNRLQIPIFVSKTVLSDYKKINPTFDKYYLLYNFVADPFFNKNAYFNSKKTIKKFVAVGSLKKQKNYSFLISVFSKLKSYQIYLDIFGEGPQGIVLRDLKKALEADNVFFRGKKERLWEILPKYDCYIMASTFEGFGIAPMEAAATGLPLFLSDIPVLKEVSNGQGIFFNPLNEEELIDKIKWMVKRPSELNSLAESAKEIVFRNYTKDAYMKKLQSIYQERIP